MKILAQTCFAIIALTIVLTFTQTPSARAAEPTQGVATAELTPDAERAMQKGIEYLAAHQNGDGSWGGQYKTAGTSLTLMAFMVKGHFPERPPYGEQLSRGVTVLVRQASAHRGYMGTSMYEHGLATLAISEVWGMSRRDDLRDSLKRAVDVILRSQNPAGGWRYQPNPSDADISATVMQIVALSSAKEAGIVVPDSVIQKAVAYVTSCQEKTSGGFTYQPGGAPGFARTAAGVMSLTMCGQRGSDAVNGGLAYLEKQPDAAFESADGFFYYAHYYAAQAMYQNGDAHYRPWYPRIRESLLKKQAADGSWAESNGIGTQMAILILGVPYRFLPIYQR
ncbi:MAG: terpene cyclase/mutase family protein [Planctomycetia bacterium]|nr:terpene cyclase/mutase family protein [Planctomycetia bacterium]